MYEYRVETHQEYVHFGNFFVYISIYNKFHVVLDLRYIFTLDAAKSTSVKTLGLYGQIPVVSKHPAPFSNEAILEYDFSNKLFCLSDSFSGIVNHPLICFLAVGTV